MAPPWPAARLSGVGWPSGVPSPQEMLAWNGPAFRIDPGTVKLARPANMSDTPAVTPVGLVAIPWTTPPETPSPAATTGPSQRTRIGCPTREIASEVGSVARRDRLS